MIIFQIKTLCQCYLFMLFIYCIHTYQLMQQIIEVYDNVSNIINSTLHGPHVRIKFVGTNQDVYNIN